MCHYIKLVVFCFDWKGGKPVSKLFIEKKQACNGPVSADNKGLLTFINWR